MSNRMQHNGQIKPIHFSNPHLDLKKERQFARLTYKLCPHTCLTKVIHGATLPNNSLY